MTTGSRQSAAATCSPRANSWMAVGSRARHNGKSGGSLPRKPGVGAWHATGNLCCGNLNDGLIRKFNGATGAFLGICLGVPLRPGGRRARARGGSNLRFESSLTGREPHVVVIFQPLGSSRTRESNPAPDRIHFFVERDRFDPAEPLETRSRAIAGSCTHRVRSGAPGGAPTRAKWCSPRKNRPGLVT